MLEKETMQAIIKMSRKIDDINNNLNEISQALNKHADMQDMQNERPAKPAAAQNMWRIEAPVLNYAAANFIPLRTRYVRGRKEDIKQLLHCLAVHRLEGQAGYDCGPYTEGQDDPVEEVVGMLRTTVSKHPAWGGDELTYSATPVSEGGYIYDDISRYMDLYPKENLLGYTVNSCGKDACNGDIVFYYNEDPETGEIDIRAWAFDRYARKELSWLGFKAERYPCDEESDANEVVVDTRGVSSSFIEAAAAYLGIEKKQLSDNLVSIKLKEDWRDLCLEKMELREKVENPFLKSHSSSRMDRSALIGIIDEAVNDIFYRYETANGIESGDIDPMTYLEICRLEKSLADLIIENFEEV